MQSGIMKSSTVVAACILGLQPPRLHQNALRCFYLFKEGLIVNLKLLDKRRVNCDNKTSSNETGFSDRL
jgi:hypothetical protein